MIYIIEVLPTTFSDILGSFQLLIPVRAHIHENTACVMYDAMYTPSYEQTVSFYYHMPLERQDRDGKRENLV